MAAAAVVNKVVFSARPDAATRFSAEFSARLPDAATRFSPKTINFFRCIVEYMSGTLIELN